MKPNLTQKNREQLFFIYFMDCQTPRKPGGGRDQTWEIAELAVRGLYELFAGRGLEHCLGFCSEPELARRQSGLLTEMVANGCWHALHFQVRGYRPPGASEDYDWHRPMTWYDYDEQREAIAIANDSIYGLAGGVQSADFANASSIWAAPTTGHRATAVHAGRHVGNRSPFRVLPQICVKPRKSNVSGLPSPRTALFSAANLPNSISRVFSLCNSSPNFAMRSPSSWRKRSASFRC